MPSSVIDSEEYLATIEKDAFILRFNEKVPSIFRRFSLSAIQVSVDQYENPELRQKSFLLSDHWRRWTGLESVRTRLLAFFAPISSCHQAFECFIKRHQ